MHISVNQVLTIETPITIKDDEKQFLLLYLTEQEIQIATHGNTDQENRLGIPYRLLRVMYESSSDLPSVIRSRQVQMFIQKLCSERWTIKEKDLQEIECHEPFLRLNREENGS